MPSNLTYSSQPWSDLRVLDPDANGVVTIFLARAEFHNALTVPMLEDLIQIFSLLDRDDRVKCIIVTGDGRMFCAGVDLKQGFGKIGRTPETHRDAHLFTTAGTYVTESQLVRDIFSEITDSPAAVIERAQAIANEIATNTSQVSTYLTRELIWRGPSNPEAAHLLESAILHRLYNSGDFKEASAAFINKRSPEFHDSMENIVPKFAPWWSHGRDTEAKPQPKL
ncbi:enoyl hydratase isomerase family [Fusarium phyllophilum]|uniref:Enoyl hydratase isomerase family n=1 Tax=Fusarium phyllophilum TaxID=47803 RepID=A0A8H5ML05_9HYPO|nr:enoyl hydratase isomerase family [Fusarium phyllophilum]